MGHAGIICWFFFFFFTDLHIRPFIFQKQNAYQRGECLKFYLIEVTVKLQFLISFNSLYATQK